MHQVRGVGRGDAGDVRDGASGGTGTATCRPSHARPSPRRRRRRRTSLPSGDDVVVHRPVVALDVIPARAVPSGLGRRQPELLAARSLQVVPDGLAVDVEELVAGDLHVHGASVHEPAARPPSRIVQMRSTRCQGPSWQYISALRIGRRELQVIQPVGRAMDDFLLAGRVSTVNIAIGMRACSRCSSRTSLASAKVSGLPSAAHGRVVGIETRIARALFELPVALRVHA